LKQPIRGGFTLIELMIVVAIIGILALIIIPQFSSVLLKSKEAGVKGALSAIRSAVNIYYSDSESTFPTNLVNALTTNSKFLQSIPTCNIPPVTAQNNPGHQGLGAVLQGDGTTVASGEPTIAQGWYYVDSGPNIGIVKVNCTHMDTRGNIWTSY